MLTGTTAGVITPVESAPADTAPADAAPVDTSTPVVILKLGRGQGQDGGLGAIRSLGRRGVPVYGVHEQRLAPAATSRYLCGSWYWSPAADDVTRLREGLVTLARRVGRRAVLLPTDDAGAVFLAEHGAGLREWFLFPDPPPDLPRRLASKDTLHELCLNMGVPTVHSLAPRTRAEAGEFADQIGFPLVAKRTRTFGCSDTPGPPRAVLVHTPDDLDRLVEAGVENSTPNLLLQEYIPRCPSQDFFFHGYFDAHSRCCPGFVGIKERSYPVHTGATCLGRWVDNPELYAQATELVARLGYRGLVDLDYRWDPRDGQYKLLDFKPRLGAQFRVFEDAAGVDVAVASHLDLTDRPVWTGPPVPGRRLLVENIDPIAALDYRRRGELNLLFWATSLRLVDEMAWFARDDLVPFGMMCVRTGLRAAIRWLTRPVTSLMRRLPRTRSRAGVRNPPRYLPGRARHRFAPAESHPPRPPRSPSARPYRLDDHPAAPCQFERHQLDSQQREALALRQ